MKVIKDTAKLIMWEDVKGTKVSIYRQRKDDATNTKVLIYEINGDKITYQFGDKAIKQIIFDGFSTLPEIISPYGFGFEEKSLSTFFKTRFDDSGIDTIVINETQSKMSGSKLYIKLEELEDVIKSLRGELRAFNDTKRVIINNYLNEQFPKLPFDFQKSNNNKDVVLRNLNSNLISKLTADEIEAIGNFYVDAASKYSRPDLMKRMVISLQKSAHLVSLQEVIKKYEILLKKVATESEWQQFFDEYITLFDNRYLAKLDYKNVATGVTKFPDLVLVDIYGYIDFYELKKSNMELLKYDKSHKTWYWSPEVSMVIAQVADYLQKAKENSLSYTKSIKDNTGKEVNIIYPRAIVVAGSAAELNTDIKRHHFKNLRESLKDIEFVLYDELLDRLKNLLESVKIQ